MTLGEQQRVFARKVGLLIEYIYEAGYEITLDWAFRPPEIAAQYAAQGIGIKNSLHTVHLAVDLNLFRDGVYLKDTEAWRLFGEWWKAQDPLCRWGGDFPHPDGNHFSMTFGGIS